MRIDIEPNETFLKAASFVIHTDRPIFLTGKAGTGKTTFLKYIQKNCPKKMAIAAPTGVAAINAGGTTLHSLFHLPFGTYLKDYALRWDESDNHIYNRHRLLSKLKFSAEKRSLIQELDLLIIDEVSMLRADMLDAIDDILKSVRRDMRPFGGLQVLFIGDLYQLPPVVKASEWTFMQEIYRSPFFFDAVVMTELQLIQIELKKIYRQSDDNFINLLNSIRNNCCSHEQMSLLNSHYQPDFKYTEQESYITLCSHNAQADQINRKKLQELPGSTIAVEALVKGDYSESAYPTENILQLKKGAQVMFIKNDKGLDRRFYNGKIGYIKAISSDKKIIHVNFTDGSQDVEVSKEEWKNIKYNYDTAEDKIKEETLGTFSQFPLRLAWAVTIHKSQGLTFDRAIIDAGAAFAPGQVYVALSRIRSLNGLVLKSQINASNIFTNKDVLTYSENILPENKFDSVLRESQQIYLMNLLLETFDWSELVERTEAIIENSKTSNIADKDTASEFLKVLLIAINMHQEVADKFKTQLRKLITDSANIDFNQIEDRTQKAADWFINKLESQTINPLENHIKLWAAKKRTKKYIETLKALLVDNYRKLSRLKKCQEISVALAKDTDISTILNQANEFHSIGITVDQSVEKVTKATKGETKNISLTFFQEGKSIEEIAKIRGFTEGTIINHLASFIGTEVQAEQLMDAKKLEIILDYMSKNPTHKTADIKNELGLDYSYTDIRIAQQVRSSAHSPL
ncbi:helix-turn-helix domain-containing protein [Albibacterium bauzanense]|uniref:Helix-turn-helix protein n=1 Tax=Albibacterium bauzanense TaxID=653929 RepID=A0A4R1LVC6_9SPHI|nr:helix-turn-helix domain-containing protein [Albibacterium bauzanense]TCK83356.1 helix-turn-helix protein [Albibacterium bauzanense]